MRNIAWKPLVFALAILALFVLAAALPGVAGPRGGGSFGGGGRSFGGGRGFGGFGGRSRAPSSSGGSFGRTGGFGSRGRITSTRTPRPTRSPFAGLFGGSGRPGGGYANRAPVRTNPGFSFNGRPAPARYYGGWSDYSYAWARPRWYHYTPFHPAFFFRPPLFIGGGYVPGGFLWLNLFLTLLVVGLVIWFAAKMLRRSGAAERKPPRERPSA